MIGGIYFYISHALQIEPFTSIFASTRGKFSILHTKTNHHMNSHRFKTNNYKCFKCYTGGLHIASFSHISQIFDIPSLIYNNTYSIQKRKKYVFKGDFIQKSEINSQTSSRTLQSLVEKTTIVFIPIVWRFL